LCHSIRNWVLALAVVSVPLASHAQEAAPPPGGGTSFLLSARLLAPWLLVGGSIFDAIVPAALPRFVAGAQIGPLGLGLGLNYLATSSKTEEPDLYGGGGTTTTTDTSTLFLIGPTVSYRFLQSPGGRVELHGIASVVYGTGGSETKTAGDTQNGPDTSALGVNAGVLGRALVVDGFGLDGGIGLDYVRQTSDDSESNRKDTSGVFEIIGFLGVTFLI
jgi:hypothetical protein